MMRRYKTALYIQRMRYIHPILFVVLYFCVFSTIDIMAQPLSIRLRSVQSTEPHPVWIECERSYLEAYAQEHKGIKIHYSNGFKHCISIQSDQLSNLLKSPWVKHIEDGYSICHSFLDSSRIQNNIDSVHSGYAPLLTSYSGKNVLIGIIDFGIDWRHEDFKHSAYDTRILSIWDQNFDSLAPQGFQYGHIWSKANIDSGSCYHNTSAQYGHGTNVAGIAAGNGHSNIMYRGIAYDSKIVAVSLKNDNLWQSHIIDGLDYIFHIADSLRIPCIVNISIGSYDGSHDGTDIASRLIAAKINKKGRAIVAAAGNAGHLRQHVQMAPQGDTLFTDFVYNSTFGGTYFNFWADTINVRNLNFYLQADSTANLMRRSNSYFFNIGSRFLDSLHHYGYYEDSMMIQNDSGYNIAKSYFYILKQAQNINFQCYIVPKNTNHLWRFSTSGYGKIHMWVNSSLQTSSDVYLGVLPPDSVMPEIRNYKIPDTLMSIASGFQCAPEIITVGNYVNKYGIIDYDTNYYAIGGVPKEIASNSSRGPTLDERIKPDIVASGGATITTIDSITSANFRLNPNNRKKLAPGGQYSVAGGTSMSAPVVTGTIGLLFQKYPDLDNGQVQYLLKKTTFKDNYVLADPSQFTYGYGKIDAFRLLSYPIHYGCRDTGSINYDPTSDFEDSTLCIKKIYGCTDTGSINYNPVANVNSGICIKKKYGCTDTGSINYNPMANMDDSSCIKKHYGCTDTFASNFDPLANVDDSSCLYQHIRIAEVSLHHSTIIPNPSNGIIRLKTNNTQPIHYTIENLVGRKLLCGTMQKEVILDLSNFAKGIYFFNLEHADFNEILKLQLK